MISLDLRRITSSATSSSSALKLLQATKSSSSSNWFRFSNVEHQGDKKVALKCQRGLPKNPKSSKINETTAQQMVGDDNVIRNWFHDKITMYYNHIISIEIVDKCSSTSAPVPLHLVAKILANCPVKALHLPQQSQAQLHRNFPCCRRTSP